MEEVKLRHLFTGFPEKELERKFIIKTHEPFIIRVLVLLGTLSYLFFIIIDLMLYKEYISQLLLIRCGIFLPIITVLMIISFTHYYENFSQYIITIVAIAGTGTIMGIEYITRFSNYPGLYFYGILITLLFFYGTGKNNLFVSFISSCIIAVPSLFIESFFIETDSRRTILKAVYLVMMILVGNLTGGIIQFTSRISFLKQCKIEEMSMTDFLTGLKNRLYFDTIMKDELLLFIKDSEEQQRETDKVFRNEERYGLMILDIDYFKKINDKYGHETGDLFLQEFSERIKNIIRSDDVFIRWGGEEFLLLVRNTYDEAIRDLAKRIKNAISGKSFKLKSKEISASVSGGVLAIPPNSEEALGSIENMIDLADQALYTSKNGGRNKFTEFVVQDSETINKSTKSYKDIT